MKTSVDIILDGKKIITKNWNLIPRVSDNISLNDGKIFMIVLRVIWLDDLRWIGTDHQSVQLVCQSII